MSRCSETRCSHCHKSKLQKSYAL